jgi:hypothetical protein
VDFWPTWGGENGSCSATAVDGRTTLPFVISRACDFIRFREKPMLKTRNLGASKSAKNQ